MRPKWHKMTKKHLSYLGLDFPGGRFSRPDSPGFWLLFTGQVLFDSAIPWTAACQASLSFTISRSLLKLMFIKSLMPSNHLILCWPILLLPSIFPILSLFQWVSSSHQVAKLLELQLLHQSWLRTNTPRKELMIYSWVCMCDSPMNGS